MNRLLSGKLALVTGAASGIGKATCEIFAKEGACIIAADQNADKINNIISLLPKYSEISKAHLAVTVNVAQKQSVQYALENVLKFYGTAPSIIVNCAGITRDNFLLKLSEQDFQQVIDVNLKGTFLIVQTFAKAIIEKKIENASVTNIASIIGKYGNLGQANYAASKAGVELLTKTAAKEFGKFGIRCNAILPGLITTPMTDVIPDKVKEKFVQAIPLGRFGTATEVANMIAFLSSDKASYVNGASIEVTGGF